MTRILTASLPGCLPLHVIRTAHMLERLYIPSRKQSGRGAGKEAKEAIGWLVWLFDNNVEIMD